MRLNGEVALVMGATRGMGRAIAERFAREGARVVVTGRNEDRGREVELSIVRKGGCARFVRADISCEAEVEAAVRAAVETFGKLTVLVNNAAPVELTGGNARIDDRVASVTAEAWQRLVGTILTGTWSACRHAIPAMIGAGKGSIVNMSSTGALLAMKGIAAYSAAKAGIHALTRSIAIEYAAQNVRANCIVVGVVPNWVTDPYFDNPAFVEALRSYQPLRLGTEEDMANAALFLASDEAGYITGVILPVDGGATAKMPLPDAEPKRWGNE